MASRGGSANARGRGTGKVNPPMSPWAKAEGREPRPVPQFAPTPSPKPSGKQVGFAHHQAGGKDTHSPDPVVRALDVAESGEDGSGEQTPYKAPSFAPSSGNKKSRSRSGSPSHSPQVPCVAHAVYTAHKNCGCQRAPKMKRRGSPQIQDFKEEATPRSTPQTVTPRTPRTPRPPPFSEPQLIGTVPTAGVRFAKVANPHESSTALVADRQGLRKSRAFSGQTDQDKEPIVQAAGKGSSLVTAMEVFNGETWCGFQDGNLKIYCSEGNLLAEASRHSAAITSFAQIGHFIYSAGLDWKIYRWNLGTVNPKDGLVKLHALSFGNHNLGVRCLAGGKVSGALPMLVSGSDDSEIRCWNLTATAAAAAKRRPLSAAAISEGSPQQLPEEGESDAPSLAPVSATYFPLKGHKQSVLALMLARDTLWSGGEDTTIRIWKIRSRQLALKLEDHKSPVVTIKKIGDQNVWTLGKSGQAVVYHTETFEPIHSMTFMADPSAGPTTTTTTAGGDDSAPSSPAAAASPAPKKGGGKKSPSASTVSTTKLQPATLLSMKPVQGHIMWVTEPTGVTNSWYCPTPIDPSELGGASSGLDEFERSELAVQQQMEMEAAQAALVDSLVQALDEHSVVLMDHLSETMGRPKTVEDGEIIKKKDQEIADLKAQLQNALAALEELKADHAAAKETSALQEELEALKKKSKEDETKFKKQLAELKKRNKDLEERMRNMMSNKEKALSEEAAKMQAENDQLKKDCADKDAMISKLKKQIDNLKKDLIDTKKQLEATKTQLDNTKGELAKATSEAGVQAQLQELTEALEAAKQREIGMQTEMETMSAQIEDLREDKVNLGAQVAQLTNPDFENWQEEQRKLRAENKRLNEQYADEGVVRANYERKISDMVKEHEAVIADLKAQIERLKKKNDDNVLVKEIDALRDQIAALKKELTSNRHHLTRLASKDLVQREKDLRNKSNKRSTSGERDDSSPRDDSASSAVSDQNHNRGLGRYKPEEHNPNDPHHVANCVWCSGAIFRGVGGTMGLYGENYKEWAKRSISRERFREERERSPQRSTSAPYHQIEGQQNGGGTHRSPSANKQQQQQPPFNHGSPIGQVIPNSARSRSSEIARRTLTPLEQQTPLSPDRLKKEDSDSSMTKRGGGGAIKKQPSFANKRKPDGGSAGAGSPASTTKKKRSSVDAGVMSPTSTSGDDGVSPAPKHPSMTKSKKEADRKRQLEAARQQAQDQPTRAALVAEILALHNEILDEKQEGGEDNAPQA